jgi:adenylyltransferase/sulfurtransferase
MDERYSRQVLFGGIGREGQERLLGSRVLLVGCGALGATHAEMLSRAGVGFLRIVDRDFVEYSNLQRQTLFSESDAAERLPKAVAARNRIAQINSGIEVEAVVADANASNIEELIAGIDLVIDGTDNFRIRYLVNDACVKHSVNWIYGAAVAGYGTTMTVRPGISACLRCVFEEIPAAGSAATCDTAGVIQPIIASVAAVQITEAFKLLTGQPDKLHGSLLQIDIWNSEWRSIRLRGPAADCPCCAARRFEFLEDADREFFTALCGRDSVQIRPPNARRIDLAEFASRLAGEFKLNEYLVRFAAGDLEITLFADGRAIIKGTDDVTAARTAYSRFVGD